MRDKVTAFVRHAISNQKKAISRYDVAMNVSEGTAALYALQHAQLAETLEIWEAMLSFITGAPVKDPTIKVGDTIISENTKYVCVSKSNKYDLTRKHFAVLSCLVRGLSNKAIANELDVTDATVKVHMRCILRRLSVKNRTEAALKVKEEGLV